MSVLPSVNKTLWIDKDKAEIREYPMPTPMPLTAASSGFGNEATA